MNIAMDKAKSLMKDDRRCQHPKANPGLFPEWECHGVSEDVKVDIFGVSEKDKEIQTNVVISEGNDEVRLSRVLVMHHTSGFALIEEREWNWNDRSNEFEKSLRNFFANVLVNERITNVSVEFADGSKTAIDGIACKRKGTPPVLPEFPSAR